MGRRSCARQLSVGSVTITPSAARPHAATCGRSSTAALEQGNRLSLPPLPTRLGSRVRVRPWQTTIFAGRSRCPRTTCGTPFQARLLGSIKARLMTTLPSGCLSPSDTSPRAAMSSHEPGTAFRQSVGGSRLMCGIRRCSLDARSRPFLGPAQCRHPNWTGHEMNATKLLHNSIWIVLGLICGAAQAQPSRAASSAAPIVGGMRHEGSFFEGKAALPANAASFPPMVYRTAGQSMSVQPGQMYGGARRPIPGASSATTPPARRPVPGESGAPLPRTSASAVLAR